MRVAVIGAGLTGLSAAVELRDRGASVTVLESAARVGGVITTVKRDGFLVGLAQRRSRQRRRSRS
jgi:protoporphyrinogen oxidase